MTHTKTTTILWPFVRFYLGEPVPAKTFTHSHLSWSSTILYQLPPSFCTTSLQVLFGLPLGLELSTSYSMHFFTQSLSSFCNTCPYHCSLFCCSTEIMSSVPSLSSVIGNLSNITHCLTIIESLWKYSAVGKFLLCVWAWSRSLYTMSGKNGTNNVSGITLTNRNA